MPDALPKIDPNNPIVIDFERYVVFFKKAYTDEMSFIFNLLQTFCRFTNNGKVVEPCLQN